MSGGSMDYLYYKVMNASFTEGTPERRAFRAHLLKIANALRDIEMNDSGDGSTTENESIRACLSKTDVLTEIIKEAKEITTSLNKELKIQEGKQDVSCRI